jgi:hypothetical protein
MQDAGIGIRYRNLVSGIWYQESGIGNLVFCILTTDMTITNCPNCDIPLVENCKFCPECGQKTNLHRLSMHDVLHDAMHYFTHADKGVLQLLKGLVTKTGTIAREYVSGKRKKYFPPLNFYLIVAGLLVISLNLFPEGTSDRPQRRNTNNTGQVVTQQQKEAYKAMGARYARVNLFMGKYSNFVAMLAVPLLALLFRLFYVKAKYNYTEHLVAGLYMTGLTNLLYGLLFVPVSWAFHLQRNTIYVIVLIVFQVVYDSIFYYHFINKGTRASALKAVGVSTFVILFWSGLSIGLIMLYISNGFWGLLH